MGNPSASTISAFDRLIVSHYESLYRSALVLSGGRHADAEDLTQQTLLKAFLKQDQLRDERATKRWLLVIARSIFLKNLQKKSVQLWSHLEMAEPESPADTNATDFPIDPQELPKFLARLDESQRLILHMYYFEELSYRQIADTLQVKIGTVMSRLARAKQRLRELAVAGQASGRKG